MRFFMLTPARLREPIRRRAKAQGTACINEQRRLGVMCGCPRFCRAACSGVQRVELDKATDGHGVVIKRQRHIAPPILKQKIAWL